MFTVGIVGCGEIASKHLAAYKKMKDVRVLVSEDQGDYVAGHVSARLPGDEGRFLMKPAGISAEGGDLRMKSKRANRSDLHRNVFDYLVRR